MSLNTKFAALALATFTLAGGVAGASHEAHAGPKGKFIAAGLVGAAIVGSAIAATTPTYVYAGQRRCGWVNQYDVFGHYAGKVRVCRY